jgi:hypothetical protein
MNQLDDFDTFKNYGHSGRPPDYDTFKDYGDSGRPPDEYKKIRVHLTITAKHDGRHRSRLVADGHLNDVPLVSIYSGVVALRCLRLLVFLAELNESLTQTILKIVRIMDKPRSRSLVSDGSETLLSLARYHLLPFGWIGLVYMLPLSRENGE